MGVSKKQGYLFGGPYTKEYSILGSILLGSPYLWKLPYEYHIIGFYQGLAGLGFRGVGVYRYVQGDRLW